jgi:hypothetical protein
MRPVAPIGERLDVVRHQRERVIVARDRFLESRVPAGSRHDWTALRHNRGRNARAAVPQARKGAIEIVEEFGFVLPPATYI